MKTIIYSQIMLIAVLIFTLNACNESGVTDNLDKRSNSDAIGEFEQTLNQILGLAGDRLQSEGGEGGLTEIFRDAYLEVIQEEARMDIFQASLENAAQRRGKSTGVIDAHTVLSESETPEEVLNRIEVMLAEAGLDEATVIELITLRQTILFLMDNYNVLESIGGRYKKAENMFFSYYDGWWVRWGRCAAGAAGGAGLGAISGCGVGAMAAVGVGCSVGAVIGGISGGLSGAAAYC